MSRLLWLGNLKDTHPDFDLESKYLKASFQSVKFSEQINIVLLSTENLDLQVKRIARLYDF